MIESIQTLFQENPIIAGGAGMAAMGWLMVQAKSLPMQLIRLVKDQFSTTMTVYSEDGIYRRLDQWLSNHPGAKRSRRFSVAQWHNRQIDDEDFGLSPGAGLHVLRQGLRYFLIHRHIEDKTTQEDFSRVRRQTINITTFGRSMAPLVKLLNEIKKISEDHTTIPIHLWNGHDHVRLDRRTKRSMDTVYANAELKADLIQDLQNFIDRRGWYADRGIPYRRGYLFSGPPGTGKTTIIFALASLFERPVYIINPAAIENDNQLQRAVNSAGSGFVVIEDIDSLNAAEEREGKVKGLESVAEASKKGITLSGLLNAIDGIGAKEGRVLFITSNHPDTLDAALIRPGRIDKHVVLDRVGLSEAKAMYQRFFPESDPTEFLARIERLLPISPADLQNRLLGLTKAAA